MAEKTSGLGIVFRECLSQYSLIEDPKAQYLCLKSYIESNLVDKLEPFDFIEFYLSLGIACRFCNDFTEAYTYFLISEERIHVLLNKKKKDRNLNNKLGKIYSELAVVQFELSNYSKSFEYAEKALKIYETFENEEGKADALNLMSLIEYKQYNYDNAERIQKLALVMRKKLKSNIAQSFNNLGEIQRAKGSLNDAIGSYRYAINIYKQENDIKGLAIVYNNLGLVKTELALIRNEEIQYLEAIQFFEQSQALYKYLKIIDLECVFDYVNTLIITKNFGKAYEQLGILAHRIYTNDLLFDYIFIVGRLELARKNFDNAYNYLMEAKNIADMNGYSSRSVLVRVQLIEWILKISRIEDTDLHVAKNWLEEAFYLAYESNYFPLVVELLFLSSSIFMESENNNSEARKALLRARKISKMYKNKNLVNRAEDMISQLTSENEKKKKVDIIQYVNRIAQITDFIEE